MEALGNPKDSHEADKPHEESTESHPASRVPSETASKLVSAPSSKAHGVTVLAGGLFALFVTLLIQAFTIFGVTSITVGHLFLACAWVVGSLILVLEVLPSRSKRLKVMSVVGLALALAILDVVVVTATKKREAQEVVPPPSAASPENLNRVGLPLPTPAATQNVPQITPSVPDRIRAGPTPRLSPASSPDDRARALRQEAEGLINSGRYPEAIAKLEQALAIPGISESMESRLKLRLIEVETKASGRRMPE